MRWLQGAQPARVGALPTSRRRCTHRSGNRQSSSLCGTCLIQQPVLIPEQHVQGGRGSEQGHRQSRPGLPCSSQLRFVFFSIVCLRKSWRRRDQNSYANTTNQATAQPQRACILQRGLLVCRAKRLCAYCHPTFKHQQGRLGFCWRGLPHASLRLGCLLASRLPRAECVSACCPAVWRRPTDPKTVAAADRALGLLQPSAPALLCGPTTALARPTSHASGWCGWCSCSV
jgi:hypothetical protein